MSLPTAVFLDTSILAGQQYNFESTAFTSFVAVAKSRSLKLLLPDPTQREVMRQIRQRSADALKALDGARRNAPFLAKWRHYPPPLDPSRTDWEVRRIAEADWAAFLGRFTVVKLGYEGVDLNEVMNWYDGPRAPFREGKKRKEFPDAFAVAALASWAGKTHSYVAVVAGDGDFMEACKHYPTLLYFPTLPSLTELLLADPSVAKIRDLIQQSEAILEDRVMEAVSDISFFHANDMYETEDVHLQGFVMKDVSVVGLGINECTFTFSGGLKYRVTLRWKEEDDGFSFPSYDSNSRSDDVADLADLSGTAKARFAPDLNELSSITLLELDTEEIEVTEEP